MNTAVPTASGEIAKSPQESFAGGSGAQEAISEVSQALDGLRELAAKVRADHGAMESKSAKTAASQKQAAARSEQLALKLDKPTPPIASVATLPPLAADTAEPPDSEPMAMQADMEVSQTPVAAPIVVAAAVKQNVGGQLRNAREALGYALDDVAAEVKIKPQHLEALEESRYLDLPSRIYALGFVRSYAGLLGLPAENLVELYRKETKHLGESRAPAMAFAAPTVDDRALPSGSLVMVTVLLALLVYAAGYSMTRTHIETAPAMPAPPVVSEAKATPAPVAAPVIAATTQTPAPAPAVAQESAMAEKNIVENVDPAGLAAAMPSAPVLAKTTDIPASAATSATAAPAQIAATAATAPPPPSRIKLKAAHDSNVRIYDAKGHLLAERTMKAGEAFYVPDHHGYTLATNDAGALKLQIDTHEMPPLGDMGEPMHNIPLDADELLQYLQ